MKIYTRTGDGGMTGTFRGRMAKSEVIAGALGGVDELNSWVGVVRRVVGEGADADKWDRELARVQRCLLVVGSILAGNPKKKLGAWDVKRLERMIDDLGEELPELKNFVLPGGVAGADLVHVARSVARRVEREVVRVVKEDRESEVEYGHVLSYLNRLSDLLFVLARWINRQGGGEDEKW